MVVPYGDADKHGAVRRMFDRIAVGYDVVNRLMTLGLDGRWRSVAAAEANVPPGGLVLDIGAGTGDLAIELALRGATAFGADYAAEMLQRAPEKADRAGVAGRTAWVRADGHRLPFANATFDGVTSAFVLRNFADLGGALTEMTRVLRPGGRFIALEASPGGRFPVKQLARAHFALMVPLLGLVFTGDSGAYRYLGASVSRFDTPEAMAHRMRAAGLEPLPARPLAGGTIAIHRGIRPPEPG